MSELKCPKCGAAATELVNLDPALIAKIKEGNNEAFPQKFATRAILQLLDLWLEEVFFGSRKAKKIKNCALENRVALIKKHGNT